MKNEPQSTERHALEILEARIAPAGVLTFLDTDGDVVTVSSSRGTTADLAAAVQPFLVASGGGFQLQKVALAAAPAVFKGTTLVISAAPSAGGDGAVDVGHIDAAGIDLRSVTIDGDLGRIDAGDANVRTTALLSLSATSLGVRGLATQSAGGSLVSTILGGVGSLALSGDLRDARFQVLGSVVDPDPATHSSIDAAAKIGAVRIGGAVIGGAETGSGQVFAKGRIGTIALGGGIVGGAAAETGRIWAEGGISTATIDGSIVGAVGASSGQLFGGGKSGKILVKGQLAGGDGLESGFIGNGRGLDSVTILGGIEGGTGLRSGSIASAAKIGLVSVTGDIAGSKGEESGVIRSTVSIQAVKIVGDVIGGAGARSGLIGAAGTLGTVHITGDLIGGDGHQSGALGSIGKLGDVTVTGDVRGGLGARSGQIVSESTIQSVTVGGSVLGSRALESGSIGSFGGLGPVKIGGDLAGGAGAFSGTILAGAEDRENDPPARIASVTIGGDITALPEDGTDAGPNAGGILADGALGPVRVTGAVLGGQGSLTGVISGGAIESVSIGRDLQGGAGDRSGGIVSTSGNIGAVVIGGALRSGTALTGGYVMAAEKLASVQADTVAGHERARALISALHEIGAVTVTRFIEFADIFAGLDLSRHFTESGARIGAVTVGAASHGEATPYLLATNIVASALPGEDGDYGTHDDVSLAAIEGGALSHIGAVTIHGAILDPGRQFGGDQPALLSGANFGIVADHVVRVLVAGQAIAQQTGPRNDFIPIGESTLAIHEMEVD